VRVEWLDSAGVNESAVLLMQPVTPDTAATLADAVGALAEGRSNSCRFDQLDGFSGIAFEGVVADRDHGVLPAEDGPARCALTTEGWKTVRGLLAPFTDADADGFQFLSDGAAQWIVSTSRSW
jgi:hypothetical protein